MKLSDWDRLNPEARSAPPSLLSRWPGRSLWIAAHLESETPETPPRKKRRAARPRKRLGIGSRRAYAITQVNRAAW
jgi:hypothetical protein